MKTDVMTVGNTSAIAKKVALVMNISSIKRKEFEDWLATKATSEIVGTSGTCSKCPVANFIKETYGEYVSVFPTVTFVNNKYIASPAWVEKFVRTLDRVVYPSREIKAHECENILRFAS